MGMATVEELSEMIAFEHQGVFGESVEKRQARKSKFAKLQNMSQDDYFDIPAIARKD
jgi:hypothetical protein